MTTKSWDTIEGSPSPVEPPSKPRIALPHHAHAVGQEEAAPTWQDELEAIRLCLDALMPLGPDARSRVLAAVLCVLDGETAVEVLARWKDAHTR